MGPQEEGVSSSSNATGSHRPKIPANNRGRSIGSKPISNERPRREAQVSGKGDSTNWNHSNQGTAETSDS